MIETSTKNYLIILFFLPIILIGQTDYQKIYPLLESRQEFSQEPPKLPKEYYITTKNKITVKEKNKLSIKDKLLYNPNTFFESIVGFEKITPIHYNYENSRLKSRIIDGLVVDKYYYKDTLNFIEFYNNVNGLEIVKSERYPPGNNDQYFEIHDIITKPLLQPEGSRNYGFYKRYKTANQSIIEYSGFYKSRARLTKGKKKVVKTSYQQTLGKRRVSEKIFTIENEIQWHLIYQYKIVNNNLVVTISNRNEIGYFLIEKYDQSNRLIEKGLFHQRNGSGAKSYYILNIIQYNPDSIIIREYKNTLYGEVSRNKNLSKIYVLKKDSFRNKINYDLGIINNDYNIISDIDHWLEENYLLSEIGYKDQKEIYTCSYIYHVKDDIINQIQCILNLKATDFEEGLIYYKERIFD